MSNPSAYRLYFADTGSQYLVLYDATPQDAHDAAIDAARIERRSILVMRGSEEIGYFKPPTPPEPGEDDPMSSSTCPKCGGDGWTAECCGEAYTTGDCCGSPVQVQCECVLPTPTGDAS